jgi:hypothetical protein
VRKPDAQPDFRQNYPLKSSTHRTKLPHSLLSAEVAGIPDGIVGLEGK